MATAISLMKTSLMFLGDFGYPPEMVGYVTLGLGYIFMYSFLFLLFMVLMNLLTGMAVSDTKQILQKAQVLGKVEIINTISYSESVLMNNLTSLQRLGNFAKLGKVRNFFLKIVQKVLLSSGAMLFESEYMKGNSQIWKEELILESLLMSCLII